MGNSRASRLLHSLEGVAYWGAAAPVLARLPAGLGYRLACRRGDWLSRHQAAKRAELARNLREMLGDELSRTAVLKVSRDWFRFASCDAVDVMRLRRGGRPLRRLVVFLEERFGITVGDADLLPDNFASVNAICAYLRAREPGRQAATHG